MPALIPTEFYATITWLGRVPDRDVSLRAEPVESVAALFAGLEGEAHGGLTRPSCSRVMGLYPRGTEIRNTRQLSILSAEELDEIAAAMGLARLDPTLLGASVVVEGIPDFSHIPPASRLQAESGATITVDVENGPCVFPGKEIEAEFPGKGALFKPAADNRRGVTAWIEREGTLFVGERLRLHIPAQPPWRQM